MELEPKFFVDEEAIYPGTIWFQYQKVPKPGGHEYRIIIPASRSDIIEYLEKREKINFNDQKKFLKKIGSCEDSQFNSVNWILGKMEYETPGIKWVFNTIDKAEIKDEKLIIYGRCSEALDDYDKVVHGK